MTKEHCPEIHFEISGQQFHQKNVYVQSRVKHL
jgi:hypothetical protein